MDGKLCPGIQTPPLELFTPSFRESPFNPEIFQPPLPSEVLASISTLPL